MLLLISEVVAISCSDQVRKRRRDCKKQWRTAFSW